MAPRARHGGSFTSWRAACQVREYGSRLSAVCADSVCTDPRAIMTMIGPRSDRRSGADVAVDRVAGHHAFQHGTVLAVVNAAPRVRVTRVPIRRALTAGCAQCRSRAIA